MARHLQEKYREYGRRKHQPFRFLVDQGINIKFHPPKPNLILDYYWKLFCSIQNSFTQLRFGQQSIDRRRRKLRSRINGGKLKHFFFKCQLSSLISKLLLCDWQDTPVQGNHMNNMLTDMYRTNTVSESRGPPTQNEFPIDISSDESDGDDTIPKSTNNGKPNMFMSITVG